MRFRRLAAGGERLATASLVQSLGIGLFMASSMAFFTRQVGLSATQVGAGLATAGAVALGVSLLGGELADRYGARRVLASLYTTRAVCCAAYAFVTAFWQFIAVTLVAIAADRTGPPVLQALVAGTVTDQRERTRVLAVVNVVRNVGLGVGAVAAGAALVSDTLLAYQITLGLIGLAFLGGAALVLRIREGARPTAAERAAKATARSVLPYPRYLVLTGLNFLLTFFDALLLVAMPVWVLEYTDAPRVMVSVLFAVNTGLVVVLQIPVSRLVEGLRRTSRLMTLAGAALAVSSLCFAAAGGLGGAGGPGGADGAGGAGDWYAIGWLLGAVVALSLGEVMANSASWELSIALAPPASRGRYLSVFNLGLSAERVLGPIVVTGLLLGSGAVGWIGAGAVFLLAGVAGERVALAAGSRAGLAVDPAGGPTGAFAAEPATGAGSGPATGPAAGAGAGSAAGPRAGSAAGSGAGSAAGSGAGESVDA
ncbi:MFS transporter [Streptomyces sp. TRM49041]|uniref:MFS transporter n=1 Tax=Streptomyces sp. TRM49041 TaxID=2603216 RepID=UPI0011EDFDDF|nr:MFS transporter [Streptomyces sp. TRM49041]